MKSENQNHNTVRDDISVMTRLMESPIFFIELMWGLVPQPIKPEYNQIVIDLINKRGAEWEEAKKLIRPEYFGTFIKGKHITWQQWIILLCVEKAMKKTGSNKISIASGHGIGKSATLSWLILWFLFSFYNAQVPCTAPTADQMYDVLWKELNLWINRIQDAEVKDMYEWESNHIRIKVAPYSWFARAKTSSKENSEALAGVHAEDVLLVADEASGIEEEIFNTAEGALTNENVLMILIGNPTRDTGYFYDTHHRAKKSWQNCVFDGEESPIVDVAYVEAQEERHGRGSVQFGIRVSGIFPNEGVMDDSGYIRILGDGDIRTIPADTQIEFVGTPILGVDPSGEGDDETPFYIRDEFKLYLVHTEAKSTPKTIASKIITLKEKYNIEWDDIVVENLGVGADVGKEVALATKGIGNITTVNTGELPDVDTDLYLNKRAEYYWLLREWCIKGGQLVEDKKTKDQLMTIRFKRSTRGKIQIIPKLELKKRFGYDSPDRADAAMLTFARVVRKRLTELEREMEDINTNNFDEHDVY